MVLCQQGPVTEIENAASYNIPLEKFMGANPQTPGDPEFWHWEGYDYLSTMYRKVLKW